ncbi:endoribonuclease Dicer-like [Tropilaelaps mercedesae]|uniref:Endoribonuclease Dicer-like n=1 Tax=Tropilaelaps mercedesae TaxID=418985 RepID=A0A1V9X1J8_9ACAR|nr:endoribonuclease Dicer-like [Tropilaelaps mercedesae]
MLRSREPEEQMKAAHRQLEAEQARSYQLEMFEFAKKHNTIVVLGTGTGKTFISVLLIKHFEHQVAGKWSAGPGRAGSKRTIFLAPTVPLVEQQASVLKQHLAVNIGHFVGAMQVDHWSSSQWEERFEQYGVLVMTPAVFKNVLLHGFMSLDRVNLLVLDECHRATGDDPYVGIMKIYKEIPTDERPRVLGLTASVVNSQARGGPRVNALIRELEATLFSRAKTATGADLFGTKPNEIIAVYTNHKSHNKLPVDQDLLNSMKDCADFKEFRKAMTALGQLYESCGPFCAKQLLMFREKEMEKALMASDCSTDFKAHASTKKDMFRHIFNFLGKDDDPFDLPGKMKRLLDILAGFRELDNGASDNEDQLGRLCGIVFVKERMTAYVLYRWMNEVSKRPLYDFINCSFVVGHNQNPFGHDGDHSSFQMNAKAQRKVMADFREGVYNLMFATSVIEEGMDVPVCNLIVRFDMPPDVRSYTQSKGRARAKPSLYVVLSDEKSQLQTEDLMDNFQETEFLVMRTCEQKRPAPDLGESIRVLEDDPDLPPYIVDTARVSAQNAVSLLYWYCQGFASEPYANVLPEFVFDETSDGFFCTLIMPLITPLWRNRLTNPRPFSSKSKARVYVALEMCRRLHKAGELTNHLLPRPRIERLHKLSPAPEDEKINKKLHAFRIKTTTYVRRYAFPRAVAPVLRTLEEHADEEALEKKMYHLYTIYTRVVQWASSEQNWRGDTNLFDPEQNSTWIGLILKEKLPENLPKFPVYTRSGEEEVELIYAGSMPLSVKQKALCHRFNRYIFSLVLDIVDNSMQCCYEHFITPCVVLVDGLPPNSEGDRNFVLNLDVMSSVGPAELPNSKKFEFNESLYQDAVVELLYHINENLPNNSREIHTRVPWEDYHRFYVRSTRSVGKDGKPLTPHTTGYYPFSMKMSFAQYVNQKKVRGRSNKITNENQPVLEVEHVQKRLEMTTPRYKNRAGGVFIPRDPNIDRAERGIYVLPEFVAVHKLKASIWRKATSLPSILHRLNGLVVAEQLRVRIVTETGLGRSLSVVGGEHWKPLRLEALAGDKSVQTGVRKFGRLMASKSRKFDKEQLLTSMEFLEQPDLTTCLGPSPGDIMKALSTKHAKDLFDMERSELLGDAFLQVASTFALIDRYQFETTRELAVYRQYQVCNRHLLYRAFERDLTSLVNTVAFHARRSFLPPGYKSWPFEERLLDPDFLRVFVGTYGYEYNGELMLKDMRFAAGYGQLLTEINNMDEEEFRIEVNQNFLTGCFLPDRNSLLVKGFQDYKAKVAGDVVEALVGVYVEKCGPVGGLRLLKWLGLDFGDTDTGNFINAFKLELTAAKEAIQPYEFAPFLHHVQRIERKLGYVFQNKMLALQAITHPSCSEHHLIEPNCRLAFIGEGVIDFLITMYIYRMNAKFNPGQLTDLRAALTNSQILAHAIVKNELHTSLLYANNRLFTAIKKYVDNIEEIGVRLNTVLGDWETEDLEEASVPRSLARLLEALLGAVFLDSGKSFSEVWKIIVEIMGYEISVFSKNIPISPVRELCTRFPGTSFKKHNMLVGEDSDMVEVTMYLRLPDGQEEEYTQIAETKKLAKTILAKKYLRRLEKEEMLAEIGRRKNAGEDTEVVRTLEDALLSSELVKSKYYRKKVIT